MYLVRNSYKNQLVLHSNKPHKDGLFWVSSGQFILLDNDLYPEVTWEGGPVKVELKILPTEKESEHIIKIREFFKKEFNKEI